MTTTTLDQPSLECHQEEKLRLLWQILEHCPGLGNMELAEIYLLHLRQEGISETRGIGEVAQAFAHVKATGEQKPAGFGCRSRDIRPDAPTVEELTLVKELAS